MSDVLQHLFRLDNEDKKFQSQLQLLIKFQEEPPATNFFKGNGSWNKNKFRARQYYLKNQSLMARIAIGSQLATKYTFRLRDAIRSCLDYSGRGLCVSEKVR
jgi:transposase